MLENKLAELIQFGEENDGISDKLHALTLALLEASTPQDIVAALASDDRAKVERACHQLVDALTSQLGVPSIRVQVRDTRPSADWGELHGLYTPDTGRPLAVIEVWMRTAKQQRVVAPRTFLRTLVHEVCHHLDYELFKLAETFHTEGFYRRESSLMKQLLPVGGAAVPAPPAGRSRAGAVPAGAAGRSPERSRRSS